MNPTIQRPIASAVVIAALATTSSVAQTNVAALVVRGAVEQPLSLALSDLQAMPRFKVTEHEKDGGDATFEGVALYDVIMRSKPMLSEHCCSNAINTVIVIEAADRYQAVFALPELDPKFGHGEILLADRRNGQPLAPPYGPLEIVAPDDKVHARWVREVNLIEVFPVGDRRAASTNSSR
jgi:DMSO/TMAO reductase YedYZ molybdopterin-dependent catalytic subunit